MKLLHFADAHIDMANYGRHDPATGLPLRVLDFLKSLDTIVDTAIEERVDLVIFAGDAYKDRSPAPTFQREWGRRIMRLSQAKIPTLLLQPLVENAIKFGLYGTTEKVTIELEAKEGDRDIEIGISNPFDPEALPPKGSGFGISGIQRRLYLLFARNDLLQTSDSDHIFKVRLKIPKSA